MPPVTADDVLKSIHDVKEIMQNNQKTMDERVNEAKGLAERALAQQDAFRKEFVSPNAPITDEQGAYATQNKGLFEGRFKLGYQKMIDLSPSNPALLPRDSERLKTIQDLHDAVLIRFWTEAYKQSHYVHERVMEKVAASLDFQLYAQQLVAAGYAKAANDILNPVGGTGANLDFTLLSSQMVDLVRLSVRVAAQFRTIPLTRAKQEFPALRSDTKSVLGGGVSLPSNDPAGIGAVPPANAILRPGFGQVAFAAVHNLGFIMWTDDMAEDSVVPFLPLIREQGAIMLARGRDAAIINGDVQTTHIDSDTTAAYDIRKAWNGLRRLGMNNEDNTAAGIVALDFNTLMKLMGKYAQNPADLVMFMNIIDWLKLAADSTLLTVDKIGIDRATLRTGVTDRVFGVDIVVTEEVRRDLAVDGEYDGVTTDNTVLIMCNRNRFWLGQKGETKVEQVRVPQALGNWLQVDVREDFKPLDLDDTVSPLIFPSGGNVPVALRVNVTV